MSIEHIRIAIDANQLAIRGNTYVLQIDANQLAIRRKTIGSIEHKLKLYRQTRQVYREAIDILQ